MRLCEKSQLAARRAESRAGKATQGHEHGRAGAGSHRHGQPRAAALTGEGGSMSEAGRANEAGAASERPQGRRRRSSRAKGEKAGGNRAATGTRNERKEGEQHGEKQRATPRNTTKIRHSRETTKHKTLKTNKIDEKTPTQTPRKMWKTGPKTRKRRTERREAHRTGEAPTRGRGQGGRQQRRGPAQPQQNQIAEGPTLPLVRAEP